MSLSDLLQHFPGRVRRVCILHTITWFLYIHFKIFHIISYAAGNRFFAFIWVFLVIFFCLPLRVYASINIPREVYVQATSHYEAGYKVGIIQLDYYV